MNYERLLKYREQHKHRLNYMPWLYWSLKPKHREWAEAWQMEYQTYLMEMETVEIGKNCFISPLAHIFAEPGRKISIGDNTFIAADCTLHGFKHWQRSRDQPSLYIGWRSCRDCVA